MTGLGDYFRSQAQWRGAKAEDYPEDEHNAQAATALTSLAEYVEPDAHGNLEAGSVIDRLTPHLFEMESFHELGGEETQRAVSRYGYGYRVTQGHHEAFLEELTALCLVDAYEAVLEGAEDPTGTLYPFEIEAAKEDVHLPRRYWERRSHSTEQELEDAVRSYRQVEEEEEEEEA